MLFERVTAHVFIYDQVATASLFVFKTVSAIFSLQLPRQQLATINVSSLFLFTTNKGCITKHNCNHVSLLPFDIAFTVYN